MQQEAHIRPRVEALEELVRRLLAGGVVISGNVISVANVAALEAFSIAGLKNGAVAWVQSLRTFWTLELSAASLVVDNITVGSTPSAGTTRWVRSEYADQVWRIGHNDWYVNATTGNDENDGAAATPLKTLAELSRRWGGGPVQQVGDPNLCINLHIMSDIASPDALVVRSIFAPDTALRILGGVAAVTRTGSLTAYTAPNAATNQQAVITDGAFGGAWEIGERLRFTSGAALNACCQLQEIGAPATKCSVTVPATTSEPTFTTVPTPVNPAPGDTYAVERLRSLPIGCVQMDFTEWDAGFFPIITMVDFDIRSPSYPAATNVLTFNYPMVQSSVAGVVQVYQSVFRGPVDLRSTIGVNCFFTDYVGLHGTTQLNGGGMVTPAASAFSPCIYVNLDADVNTTLDDNFQVWGTHSGGVIVGGNCVLGSFAVFKASAGGLDAGGHGLVIGNATVNGPAIQCRTRSNVWGSGNAGKGIRVAATSRIECEVAPIITGTAGDFQIYTGTQARAFDEGAGGYTAARNCTWALFNTTVALGGFGGCAHNLTADAHIVLNAGAA